MKIKSTKLYKLVVVIYLKLRSLMWTFGAMCAHAYLGVNNGKKTLFSQCMAKIFGLLGVQAAKILTHSQYVQLKADGSSIHPIHIGRVGRVVSQVYDVHEEPIINQVPMEDLYMVEYNNISIHGGSDVVCDFDRNVAVCDYAYNLNEHAVACSANVIKKQYHRTALVCIGEYGNDLESGILLNATFSNNYYHIIYDILIKLQLLDELDIPLEIPLIVDNCILRVKQFKEILDIMNTSHRNVIWIEDKKYYKVHKAYFISSIHQVPQQVINQQKLKLSDFAFDEELLAGFREKILKLKSEEVFPKRIFISRKGLTRRQYNEDELLNIAKQYDVEVVHPETLSFVQQVTLFNQADIVIGATGAAFTNVLFMKKGAYAICFVGEKVDIPVFTTGAYISQSHLLYVAGKLHKLDTTGYSFQAGFTIQPTDLKNILEKIVD